jgi:predicted nucleotidyltransferase component of viral defense system
MIKQNEIKKISEELGVTKSQIDKDWVLSYLLHGITSMPEMQDILVFKGGTSLKKCWFPEYRFSEDLDFTILEDSFVFDKRYVNKILKKATDYSFSEEYNRGILFKIKEIVPTHSDDIEQGFKVFIQYWGADHRKNDLPSETAQNWHHTIKLDINHTEEIIFPVQDKPILHNYSDSCVFDSHKVRAYSIEEVLSEKLRTLIQRKYTSPRDYYDIWYLKNNIENLSWDFVKSGFYRKMENKKIIFEGVKQLLNPEKERILRDSWTKQLSNQFPKNKAPDFNIVIIELSEFFKNLFQ